MMLVLQAPFLRVFGVLRPFQAKCPPSTSNNSIGKRKQRHVPDFSVVLFHLVVIPDSQQANSTKAAKTLESTPCRNQVFLPGDSLRVRP